LWLHHLAEILLAAESSPNAIPSSASTEGAIVLRSLPTWALCRSSAGGFLDYPPWPIAPEAAISIRSSVAPTALQHSENDRSPQHGRLTVLLHLPSFPRSPQLCQNSPGRWPRALSRSKHGSESPRFGCASLSARPFAETAIRRRSPGIGMAPALAWEKLTTCVFNLNAPVPKTLTPSQAELHPRGRCSGMRQPNRKGSPKCYRHPGSITNTFDSGFLHHFSRGCQVLSVTVTSVTKRASMHLPSALGLV
jgi:hypothetical protein